MKRAMQAMGYQDLGNGNLAARIGDTDQLSVGDYKRTMDTLFKARFDHPQLSFLRERTTYHDQPFLSHAILVLGMVPVNAPPEKWPAPWAPVRIGYRLQILDSNSPDEIATVDYRYGDVRIDYCLSGHHATKNIVKKGQVCYHAAVYPDYPEDLKPIEEAITKYCHDPSKVRAPATRSTAARR
jgi:hypothetical protein